MDMRKYSTGVIIKPEDLYEGPRLEKIINVSENEKHGCAVLEFESGDSFYCWPNYTRILSKAWGWESEKWLNQEVELALDHYTDKKTDAQKETVKLRAVSPAKPASGGTPSKAIAAGGALPSRNSDMDDDIPFAPEWR